MKKGLGRGLEALFSIYEEDEQNASQEQNIEKTKSETKEVKTEVKEVKVEHKETSQNSDGVVEISMKQIDPNKNQPRKTFDADTIKELSESIKQHGVIQPIIVNDEGNGRYTIIAGERRFRASLVAGKTTIPAIIRKYTPKQVKEVALIENLQREDLNPIDAAKGIKELMNEYNFTQESVADRIGKSRSLVANTLRLLTLPNEVVDMIAKGKISAGHGKCLVGLESKEKQIELANVIIENKLSVRELEAYIKNGQSAKPQTTLTQKEKLKPLQSLELKELTHRIAMLFKTKVKISGTDKKGKIIIDYYTVDDLDRIYSYISSMEDNSKK